DFLDEAGGEGGTRAASALTPPRDRAGDATTPATTPADPRALLMHAATLLPADPRPLGGLLAQSFAAHAYDQALGYCARLLALAGAKNPRERARLLVEKAYVLLRQKSEALAHALLGEALALCPEFPPALRALRQLARE